MSVAATASRVDDLNWAITLGSPLTTAARIRFTASTPDGTVAFVSTLTPPVATPQPPATTPAPPSEPGNADHTGPLAVKIVSRTATAISVTVTPPKSGRLSVYAARRGDRITKVLAADGTRNKAKRFRISLPRGAATRSFKHASVVAVLRSRGASMRASTPITTRR